MTMYSAFKDARDRLVSMASGTGYFDQVGTHEPKNPPGKGLGCFMYGGGFVPAPAASGLSSTSIAFVIEMRIQCSMTQEPQDDIDLNILEAADAVLSEINGDFDLGSAARNVDIFGQFGEMLQGKFGYLDQGDTKYRVLVIMVPFVINDVWSQEA